MGQEQQTLIIQLQERIKNLEQHISHLEIEHQMFNKIIFEQLSKLAEKILKNN